MCVTHFLLSGLGPSGVHSSNPPRSTASLGTVHNHLSPSSKEKDKYEQPESAAEGVSAVSWKLRAKCSGGGLRKDSVYMIETAIA